MLIALDARTIYQPHRRGTGKNLIDLYREVTRQRPDWRVVAFHRQLPDEPAVASIGTQVVPQRIEAPGDRMRVWQRWRLPLAAWQAGADLLHCPANTSPAWMPVPTVVTIHDLIPLDMPGHWPEAARAHFARSIRHACRRAAWIICPSQYTRQRLVAEFNADPARVSANPWAADSSIRPTDPGAWPAVLARYGVSPPFVLHFGAADPRKNTLRLIEAWALLPKEDRGTWQLLVVGLDEAAQRQCGHAAAKLGLGSGLRLRGFAHEEDLPTLLSAAEVLAYPSLSEGFGLPILDAWAAGTAVLTSSTTSLPEVAGEAAELVDPADPAAIAGGLSRLLSSEQRRRELVLCGRQRLGAFTWRATAERFIAVLEQTMALRSTRQSAA